MDQTILTEMKQVFNRRRQLMIDGVSSIPGITINEPEGAFYAFPKISDLFGKVSKSGRKITNSLDFCEILLEEANVACVPGIGFGSEGYMRLSYATADDVITDGLNRIRDWVNSLSD
jgi:aspartate aminotransferase